MSRIDSHAELQEAIQVLESKQKEDLKSLKKEFEDVKERLKPKNLIREGINKVTHSSALRTTLIVAATGILSFLAIKKIRNRRRRQHEKKMNYQSESRSSSTSRQAKKMSGSIIQYVITAILSRYADKIKDVVFSLLSNIKSNPSSHSKKSYEPANAAKDTAKQTGQTEAV